MYYQYTGQPNTTVISTHTQQFNYVDTETRLIVLNRISYNLIYESQAILFIP